MTKSPFEPVWPERLMIRDTGLYDDLGGGGQRIYTTAGRGYERCNYIRADVVLQMLDGEIDYEQFFGLVRG